MIDVALFLQVAFFVAVCFAFVSSRSASFFHPLALYLIFHLLVFVIRPLMVHFLNYAIVWRYMGYTADEWEFVYTLWVSSVALLVFAVAALMGGRCKVEFSVADLPPWTVAEKRAFALVVILVGPLAVYSAIIAREGASFTGSGDVQMTRDIATGIAVYTNTTGYIADANLMLGAVCLLALWRFNFRWWAYMPFLLFIGYRAFIGWGRWSIIMSLLSLVLIFLYRNNRRWLKLKYLVLAVPVAVLFQSLSLDRDLVRDYVDSAGVNSRVAEVPLYSDKQDFWEQFDTPDFANFEFLAFILWAVPEKSQTYTYFTQYLQLFTEPIPRIIWKEKPIGQPIKLINLNDFGNFTGMTTALVGDGWMSLGWIGVVMTMGLVGLFLGRIHRWFWANQNSPKAVMTYCMFLPLSIQWYRDGGISIAKFVLFSLMPIILWALLSRMVNALLRNNQPLAARFSQDRFAPRAGGRPSRPPSDRYR